MQLLIYIFAALGTGGAVVEGQYLGSGKKDKACESSEQLIWFSALVSLAVMAALFALKTLILNRFFGQITPEVRGYLLAGGLGIGAIGVWLAMTVDWLFRAVVFGFRWLGGKWKLKKVI